MLEVIEAIGNKPKTVRASGARGRRPFDGQAYARAWAFPRKTDLVVYNSGGQARAAVAGGVVDFIAVSAKGRESIKEYSTCKRWSAISPMRNGRAHVKPGFGAYGLTVPVLPGSVRGFATSAQFKKIIPIDLKSSLTPSRTPWQMKICKGSTRILDALIGPEQSTTVMKNLDLISKYSYLLEQ